MATIVDEDGTVNPPAEKQTKNYYPRVKDARGKWVSDKGPNQPYLQFVIVSFMRPRILFIFC